MGILSATGAVIAIMAGDLFVGTAVGHLGGDGTLAIHSQRNPAVTCTGQFTSSAELGGKGQLKCSDGSTATFRFTRLDMRSGHGVGKFSRGPMSFAYGLTAEESVPHLKLPKGKKLVRKGAELELVENAAGPSLTCAHCGRIESKRRLPPGATNPGAVATYEYTVRMADGSSSTFEQALPATWRVGERLTVIQ